METDAQKQPVNSDNPKVKQEPSLILSIHITVLQRVTDLQKANGAQLDGKSDALIVQSIQHLSGLQVTDTLDEYLEWLQQIWPSRHLKEWGAERTDMQGERIARFVV